MHRGATCILIVDDNPVIRQSLRRVLESVNDWRVCEAGDGQEGVEQAENLRPDLIILDLSMPRLNGLEAARVLRKKLPSIPLIMYSINMDKFVEQAAVDAGVSAVVSKVDDVNRLVTQAQVLLECH
jgi:CheY-like chemotaxis protein